jgi:hypothetical protein
VPAQRDGGVEAARQTHVLVLQVPTTMLIEHDAGWKYQKVVQETGRLIVEINIAASANCEATRIVDVSGSRGR